MKSPKIYYIEIKWSNLVKRRVYLSTYYKGVCSCKGTVSMKQNVYCNRLGKTQMKLIKLEKFLLIFKKK